MQKREWDAGSNGKLPHLFTPSKTVTYVPEFAMENLPLGRISALVTEFAVKYLPLGRTVMMMMNRGSNPGPLGWQADVLTTIPNRRSEFT